MPCRYIDIKLQFEINFVIMFCFIKGGRCASEGEMDPAEMWSELGLLVIESRQPHDSYKGWKEGPHCSGGQDKTTHHCSPAVNPMVNPAFEGH